VEVHLSADQQAFVRQAIADGRLHDEQEAVREALALWEERERRRRQIIVSVEAARAEHTRGAGQIMTAESMRELASDVKAGGHKRLSAEQHRQD
jgi:Arc/MetJ-type ribon-helix-helix transcriptional regulator